MNRKQIFVALVMVIVFISAISLVCASENADNATMTSNTDNSAVSQATNVDENILGETPKSFDELNDVIQNGSVSAGGTILLNHNYTYSQSDSVGTDGIRINRDITIDGQGYTLDGAGESSIFRITGDSHVILKNINFVNGHGSSGGAIRFSSYENVEIYNSNFTNNSASVSGGAIYIYSAGSISLNSKIVNSTFTNNVAATGGAISASGTLTSVVSSNFYYNNATNNGGSLFLDVGAYVDRCLFEHGHAANDGGAIYLNSVVGEDSTIDDSILEKLGVFNSVMVDCSAGRNGGAGYINANKGTVRNVTFAYNTAGGSGGAGYVSGSNGKLIGSRFINNTAANDGGAVMWIGLNGTIQSVTIINNTATEGNGGGIYLHPSDAVSAFSGISIVNMSTFNHNTAGQYGGALYCGGIFSIIRNSTFTYDEAYDGAGIYLDVGAAIANCNFFKESASNDGGAIYLSASNSDISSVSPELLAVFINYVGVRHSSIINCSAGHDGGAGYVRGNYGVVNNVTMTNNYAGHDGGAGYVAGDYGVLSNSRMINNAAGHDGGALMWVGNGGNATSINCMLNLARGGSGGSIYISGTNVSLSKSNFSLSNATFSGGALYVAGDNVNVSQSLFDKCAANALHGGAMYVSGSNATIQKSNFTMNRVNMGIGQGGSINIQGDDAEISECYFDRCTSSQGGLAYINGTGVIIENTVGNRSFAVNGGAFYINGDNVTIRNSNVSLTNATTSGGALYVEGDFANITNVDFSQCIAYTGSGGAIYINGLNTTISESDFVQNIVPGQTARGGSIYVQGNGTKILNSDFDKCTAFEGGVIYVNGSYVTIDGYSCNRSFAKNNGGAIYVMGDNVTVSNFNMSNTNATNYGGALYIAGNFANVSNSNFTRCIADNYHGGAMYIAGLNTTISNSNFAQNKVNTDSGRGGSIDVQGDGAKILNCTFDRCTAFEGGVIYVNGSNVIIDGYSCNRSLATNNGGAIYVAGDYVTISDFDISHTNATNYGGALYVTGNHVNITNSNFSRCIAYEGHGGCIFVSGLDAMIANSSFTQNRVAGEKARGGSIDIQGNGTKIVNCNFTMCSAYEGGVVYVNGSNVQINNSIASKTSALNDGGAIYIAGNNVTINNFTSSLSNATTNGGAIYVEGNDTQILNSDFRNTTSLLGAGIYVSGDGIILDNSTFKYNNAIGPYFGGLGGAGGAVYIEGDNGTISNSDFEYSHTYNYGASIYVAGDNTNITGNTFDKCSVDRFNGGAIFVKGLNTTISDSNFTQNIVNVSNFARGGSIDVEGDYTKILNCNFDKCTAYEGGVIYVTGEYLTIDNSNFTKSNAINDGGAIYIAGNDATVSNSNFTLNNATNYGGSIYVAGNNANITGDTFENCTANMYNGGAIYIRGVNTTIEKSNFTRNRVNPANWAHGGAIDVEGDNTTISDSVFDQCMAWDGGVIYVSGDNAVIDNATITHSSAKENGGAIYVAGDYVTVSNSDISMNNATSFGGAIYVAGDNTNITGNNFTMCIVEYYHGGAIFVLGVNTTIDSSNFLMCNASGSESRGGAIDVHGEGTNITNSHFDKCHANDLGGTIYVDGANVLIDCSTFNRSSANNGGSIYILGHYATISNSNVSYSNATVSGGGIYVEGYFSNITNADFNYCFAITGKGGAIYVAGNNATITDSDFNITRSLNGNGGALYITGNHTDVFISSFDRCGAINGGVIYVEGYDTDISGDFTNSNSIKDGGTLYIVGEECDVFNSTFINNIAGDDGGAIYWEGSNGAVYNITCVNNKGISSGTSASKGGTICLTGDNASISKASFEDSFSKYNGGTIFITGNNVNITDTEFKDSYVDSSAEITSKDAPYGGALYVLGNNTNVLNCTFDNCTAMHGGVMYVEGNNANINATFKNSNCTKDGGALYVLGLNCTVFDSTFVNNTAGDDGGAIYWEGDGGSIDNISCENNKGISAGTSSSKGGTICLTGDDASISNATFTDSFSNYNGGTIFVTGNNANITDSSFKNSQVNSSAPITSKDEPYGGALCIIGNNTDVLNCTFDNCTALQGGVMYISGHNTTVDESSMKNSLSIKEGGAVYVAGDNATISADFENCNASTDSSSYVGHGGAIYISGDFTNITDSSFEGCYAKNGGDGGAIYIGGLDANVEKSSFNKTGTVSGYGGAIYIDGDQATISDSEINDSFVGRVPGWELNDEGTIVGFTSSLARDGGAIYVKSEGAKIDNVTIMNSNATRNGGAIYVEGSGANISATIINCTSGLPASEVSTNPDDYMSHIDVISECLDAIDTFIDNYGSVSVDKSNELLTYLNNAKGKVSNIFTKVNNVFSLNQANFNYVNNTVALLNSTLQSYKNTGFYNDVMPYIEAIVADLNNISENENYDAFNKVLKNNITNNFNKIINYVTYYKELLTFLDNLQDNVEILKTETDYDVVKLLLTDSKSINDKLKSRATSLRNFNDDFAEIVSYANVIGSEITSTTTIVNGAYDSGIKGDGGAIYVHGVNTNISDSSFENCSSLNGGNGGAIYIGGVNATVNSSDFENCHAEDGGNGGAIYIGGVNATIDQSSFHKTGTVEGYGGAIYVDGNNAVVSHSTFNESFVGRYADLEKGIYSIGRDGGAIYIRSEDAVIEDVTIMFSNATRHGGAIYVQGNDANISANITNCTAGASAVSTSSDPSAYLSHVQVISDNVEDMIDFFNDYGPLSLSELNTLYNSFENIRSNNQKIFVNGAFNQANYDNIVNKVNDINKTLKNYKSYDFYNVLYPYLEAIVSDLNNISENKNYTQFNSVLKTRITNNAISARNFINYYKTITTDWLPSLQNNVATLQTETDYNVIYSTLTSSSNIVSNGNFKDRLNKLIDYDAKFIEISNNLEVVRTELSTTTSIVNSFNDNGISGCGGGIYIAGDNTYLHDSEINNCYANLTAGAVYLGKNTTVIDSSFANNTATYGGAMYNAGNGSRVFTSSFINNTATWGDSMFHGGGAIYWIGGSDDDVIDRCYFENNTAPAKGAGINGALGGAIFWNKGNQFGKGLINNSVFYNNFARRHGGAIDWFQSDGGIINNCTFEENYVGTADGGAVYCGDSNGGGKNFIISNSTFTNNKAVQFGGGISSQMTGAKIINCTFEGNNASYGASIGIKDTYGKNAQIINCTILDSYADGNKGGTGGAAIYIRVDNVTVINTTIINSTAHNTAGVYHEGGAIYWSGSNGKLNNVTIINASGSNGGAIFWSGTNGFVDGVHIYNSTATLDGGAIYWTGTNGKLYNSTLVNNTAKNGGGLYWSGSNPTAYNNTYILNNASQNGGGIYWAVAADITNATLKNNTANQGGGIYWATTGNSVIDSVLIYNKAFRGSGIFTLNNMDIINSTLLENRANSDTLTLMVTRGDADQTLEAFVTFTGNDNIINAIWNGGANSVVGFTNVTYLGVNGTVSNTGSTRRTPTKLDSGVQPSDNETLYQTNYEDHQNITYYIYDNQNNLLYVGSTLTNISGVAHFTYQNTASTDKLHVWAYHPDDNYYTYLEESDSKKLVYIEIPTTDIYYLENETFIINVVPVKTGEVTPTGNISVWFENELIYENIKLVDGKSFQINITGLKVGTYTVNVTYTGDDEYLPRVNSTTFKVMKIPSFIIPTVENYTYGEQGKVIVHIPVNEPNNVTLNINGQDYEVKINESGYGELLIPKLGHGNYTVYAYYPETHNYYESRNSTVFEIYPLYSVVINKTSNISQNVTVGGLVNFTIELYNNGSVNGTNLNVTDKLSKYFQYVSSGSNSTYVGVNSTSDGTEMVTWNIGTLQKDERLKLWLVVRVLMNGTYENVAVVNSTQGLNTSNTVTVNVTPVVDISITKKINVTGKFVNVTDLVMFTITVTNNGPSNATHVVVNDTLIKILKIIEDGITVTNGTYNQETGLWTIDKLNNGTSETLTIIARVVGVGVISNVANVTSAENDTNKSNNNASSENVTALPIVDLNITKTVNVTVANVTDLVNFTITVTNNGPWNATGVYVIDILDDCLKFLFANATKGSYNDELKTWEIGNLGVGKNATLNITVRVTQKGTIPNTAIVRSIENDTNKSNNIAKCEFKALPIVDISINKTVNVTVVNVSDKILYTITVHNNGPCDAHGVYVWEAIDTTYLNVTYVHPTIGRYIGDTWIIDDLLNGSTHTLTIIAKVKTNGTISNFVNVTSVENDTNISNNNYTCKNVTAYPIVDLTINKTVTVAVANVSDEFMYRITVHNNGPSLATGVNVTEKLSPYLELVDSNTWINDYNETGGYWYIGDLEYNATVWLDLYVKVIGNGTISNVVSVTSNENDTNISNNNYTCKNVTAYPVVDLIIKKNVTAASVNVTDKITFTIVVTNNGPSNATKVNVTEVLDSRFRLLENHTTRGNFTGKYWYIGDLANKTNATLTLLVEVKSDGYIENRVEVTSFENDTNPYNNHDMVAVYSSIIYDLQITKTVNVTKVNVTDKILYTITVHNNGPCDAEGVYVGEIFDYDHLRMVGNHTEDGTFDGTWVIGKLANQSTAVLTIEALVINNGTIPNVAIVYSEHDTNKSNNNASSENVTALPIVDLTINKTVTVTKVNVSDEFMYRITVHNNGPSLATGVNVTEILSPYLELLDSNTWINDYNETGGYWYIGDLEYNATVWLDLYVKVIGNGTISNVVSVTSNVNDTNKSNNNYTCDNVTAYPIVDLIINKTVNVTKVNVTDLIEFTITVTNKGPSNATHVNITERLSGLLEIVEGGITVSNGTYSPKDGLWTIDLLANGTDATLTIVARVISNGTVSNVVSVTSYENDTNKSNNNASSDNVTALPIVDLKIIKTVNVTVVNVTDLIRFNITVINYGPSNATHVNITERLSGLLE
ncbi:Ig-like domain repeat protein, partial [Methanobrevibacter sp.]|uniref:right-handed parallel beta-helix repeat-containing protein n=1 Tax=Methanobrevibacter sp. TaxID=66852 RepID=UPI002702D9C6|nr:hypothetical protein [Methanobrevibacter sp.]